MIQRTKLFCYIFVIPALVVLTGALLFMCGFTTSLGRFTTLLPRGAVVGGCDVGGLDRDEAQKVVRRAIQKELSGKRLCIRAGDKTFVYTYPELTFCDNVYQVLQQVKRKGEYPVQVSYHLNGEGQTIENIAALCEIQKKEPQAIFHKTGEPFTYVAGNDGKTVQRQKLADAVHASLKGGFADIIVPYTLQKQTISTEQLKKERVPLAQFTTCYDQQNVNRSHNIARACALLNGSIIPAGGTFSFNERVGERTLQNGFLQAKVIMEGRYEQGIGGGVCQVSTTLYNAALLAGCAVTEYHPHSLSVGYVPPSRDAMVSWGACDLRFVNPYKTPVFLRISANNGLVRCTLYGKDSGIQYALRSVITATEDVPSQTERRGEYVTIKGGLKSECYLMVTQNGVQTKRLIRKDRYLPLRQKAEYAG